MLILVVSQNANLSMTMLRWPALVELYRTRYNSSLAYPNCGSMVNIPSESSSTVEIINLRRRVNKGLCSDPVLRALFEDVNCHYSA